MWYGVHNRTFRVRALELTRSRPASAGVCGRLAEAVHRRVGHRQFPCDVGSARTLARLVLKGVEMEESIAGSDVDGDQPISDDCPHFAVKEAESSSEANGQRSPLWDSGFRRVA
ncbi:hypothetical protein MRX96_036601 [Rhipicephalus microplus]